MHYVKPADCKDFYRQHDIGVGIEGPGCRAPARFIDYTWNHHWVRNNILRIGQPAVSRLSDQEIVLRRSLTSIPRYGPCDLEEIKSELFSDETDIERMFDQKTHKVSYNAKKAVKPKIYLRRLCSSPTPICYAMQTLKLDFYVDIFFVGFVKYSVKVYGKERRLLDMKRTMAYFNAKKQKPFIWRPVA
ncbi:uncharacterized protein LOC126968169 [Leptidea sinapis]|uniref:uncharacterized protein LOC126968169 n=1 Tax=Leptidea sinapis TaxID=189913 RepID=UPI0021C38243|nr:uncharacterized protein LOC126968169 [Leptidea sinapis]